MCRPISIVFCSTSRAPVGCLYDNLWHFLTNLHHPGRVCWIWIRWAPSRRSGALARCRVRVQQWRIPAASRTTASRTAASCLPLSAWNSKRWFETHHFILEHHYRTVEAALSVYLWPSTVQRETPQRSGLNLVRWGMYFATWKRFEVSSSIQIRED